MYTNKRQFGFTVIELLVAVIISSVLISLTIATYNLFRKTAIADQSKSDLDQNGRVAIDRLTRNIRQTPDIVTILPDDANDTSVAEPHEIEFEDGNTGDLTYQRYYLNGTTLELDTKEYYFTADPSTRVHWNTRDASSNLPVAHVISTQDIALNVSNFTLYGYKPVEVYLTTSDPSGQKFMLRTAVTGRNL
jgi:prepilin-type N-terminal cleavage/methylation domain-containing protein